MDKTSLEDGKRPGWLRRLAPVAVLLALLIAFFAFGLDRYFTFESLKSHRVELQAFVARNLVLAILLYVMGYAVLTAASLPIATLVTLVGGFLFGAVAGAALTVVGATAGATVVFLIARTAFGDALRLRARPYIGRMEEGFARNAWSYMLFLRLMPIFPFFAVNIVPAFLGVKTRIYVVTTFIGIIPGTAVFNIVGAGLGSIFDSGEAFTLSSVVTPEIVIGLAGLALLALAPAVLRHCRGRHSPTSRQPVSRLKGD
ncbi:MAG: TVP38/TMEM64 family protein [Proteobacteria bacterium]|nr:TVP38/TMEM64 family protein [Pseudomonadota bacterium]MDA0951409.1 TVP38/TMEM64 family protein [Pseudomonadota bacterium]MDA1070248.1 TVP38/TMEM64 family protein [Pseudomonadota bacterium]